MHAVTFDEPGGPEVLAWTEVPDPNGPGAGELLLEVLAAGVNNADLLQRRGRYPVPPGASPILGLECSARVIAIGDGAPGFAVGDLVCALLTGGGYAERVVVPAVQALPVPAGVDPVAAAGLPEVVCTVYSNLRMTAHLAEGETVLIHGGGSGIGTFAIQWAKALGARVVATAGSAPKLEAAKRLGADVVIDYRGQDFVAATRAANDGRGADVILDLVGVPYLERNLDALAPDGRLLLLGGDTGPVTFPLHRLMAKRASITATALRPRPVAQKGAIVDGVLRDVWPLFERGTLSPVIDSVVPLEDAAEGHRLLAGGDTIGKVVLRAPAGAQRDGA